MWRGIGLLRESVGEWVGSRSMGRPRKRWIDTVKECLGKRNLGVRQARRMVRDRSVWLGFVRCHNFIKPLKGGSPSVAETTT